MSQAMKAESTFIAYFTYANVVGIVLDRLLTC